MPIPEECTPDVDDKEDDARTRCYALLFCMLGVLAILGARIAWLQLIKSDEMDKWARRQQDYITFIPGERGSILDRNGILLNKSIPKYDLALRIESIRDPRDTQKRTLDKVCVAVSNLASFLGPDFYRNRPTRDDARRHIRRNTPMPFVLWRNIPRKSLDKWAAHKADFPGIEPVMSWKRHYEYPKNAFHVRGFTGMGPSAYPPEVRNFRLDYQEPVGKSGIEEALDAKLCGYGGYEMLRTDVLLYRHDVTASARAVRGEDVAISIDIKLQAAIENIFRDGGHAGALVILDLRNSEVLACVSEPCPALPPAGTALVPGSLVNRALAGFYPPGSTIKPLVAITALAENAIKPDDFICCNGQFKLNDGQSIACSHRNGHGLLNLSDAIAASCNTFFCTAGTRLANSMNLVGADIGLGSTVDTLLWKQERAGIRFSPNWVHSKRRDYPVWTEGDAANAAIGQGPWIVTPLQLTVATAALATGKLYHPAFLANTQQRPPEPLGWNEQHRMLVFDAMRRCVDDPIGTGHALRIPGIKVAAKTGTAQTANNTKPHALIIAAAPADKPILAAVCIVEHGGAGGRVAGPILKQALTLALNTTTQAPHP